MINLIIQLALLLVFIVSIWDLPVSMYFIALLCYTINPYLGPL